MSQLVSLPLFQAGWVLWFLIGLSLLSIAVMVERAIFFNKRKVDLATVRRDFSGALEKDDYESAAKVLERVDSLETNAVLFGLREHKSGADAVEDLVAGIIPKEKERYDARLDILATLASNAPFVGLFGTVLGIIRAFKDLAGNIHEASSAVMAGVAEALVATAVGLFVAIPALVALNVFRNRVRKATNNATLLAKILLAHLKSTG